LAKQKEEESKKKEEEANQKAKKQNETQRASLLIDLAESQNILAKQLE